MHHDWLSYSRTGNVLHAFLRPNIQELTFHQTVKTELSDSPDGFKAWQSGYHFMITSTEFWAMKRILSLHSRTGNVLHTFINQLSHTCSLQEGDILLPPLTSHLQPVFYYLYSLLLLLVNRELENSVSMVMWAW